MFTFQFCPQLQDKHYKSTMTVTMTMTGKTRYMPPPLVYYFVPLFLKQTLIRKLVFLNDIFHSSANDRLILHSINQNTMHKTQCEINAYLIMLSINYVVHTPNVHRIIIQCSQVVKSVQQILSDHLKLSVKSSKQYLGRL